MTRVANPVTIVTYHYVRPIIGSRFPGIKGLETSAFEAQLNYLAREYAIVRPVQVADALERGTSLPANAALLTFDDGYVDHERYVLPALLARGLSGVFFPPTAAVLEREMLDVNRVHFILASAPDPDELERQVESEIEAARRDFALKTIAEYRSELRHPYFFDGPAIGYVKRLLQHALPYDLRARIARTLFAQYVSGDERAFADELYLGPAALRRMSDAGMEIGSHGHRHQWLGLLDSAGQAEDIDQSLAALASIGLKRDRFWFGYPYGSHNDETVALLAARGCVAAVTTVPGVADCGAGRPFELPRRDTVEFQGD